MPTSSPSGVVCEIVRDAEAELIEAGLRIEGDRHFVLKHDPWPAFLNRELKRKDLFLYRHLEADTYVLAAWTKPGVCCVELDTFTKAPGHFDADCPSLLAVKALVRPHQEKREEAVKIAQEHRGHKEALRLDTALERKSRVQHLKQTGGSHQALEAGCSFLGVKEGGEAMVAMKEQVITAAKIDGRSDGPWYDHLKPKKESPCPSPKASV